MHPTPQQRFHALQDLCDTLEPMASILPFSPPSRALSDTIDTTQLMDEDSFTLSTFAKSASEIMLHADALLHSLDLPKDSRVASMLQVRYRENLERVAGMIASEDLATWNHAISVLVAKGDFSAAKAHAYRVLPLITTMVDTDIMRRNAVGSLLNQLSDTIGEDEVAVPGPKELFDVQYLDIHVVLPDSLGQPVMTTLTYNGEPLVTLENRAFSGVENDVDAPLDNLTLANMAQEVFYQGDSAKGIPAMAVDHNAVEQRLADALAEASKNESPKIMAAVDRIAGQFSQWRTTTPNTPQQTSMSAPGM